MSEREATTTKSTDIKSIIWNTVNNLMRKKKIENSNIMEKFLDIHKLPKATEENRKYE